LSINLDCKDGGPITPSRFSLYYTRILHIEDTNKLNLENKNNDNRENREEIEKNKLCNLFIKLPIKQFSLQWLHKTGSFKMWNRNI